MPFQTPILVEETRAFNRHWSELLGLLNEGLLDTEYSLPQARAIFELARKKELEQSELRERLNIDASFLTRILDQLSKKSLVVSSPSRVDGRRILLSLTPKGRRAFAKLNRRSIQQVTGLLKPLRRGQQRSAVEAMTILRHSVEPVRREEPRVELRGVQPGDLGWVIQRHGEIYGDEYGWNLDFEVLVTKIVGEYASKHKPDREQAWIALVDGARAGCIFCCQRDQETAQLRILLVEPWARGLGIGSRLVQECIGFANQAGYEKLTLWTNSVLVSARRIYEAAGFRLVSEQRHESFGHSLTGQNWDLDLTGIADLGRIEKSNRAKLHR